MSLMSPNGKDSLKNSPIFTNRIPGCWKLSSAASWPDTFARKSISLCSVVFIPMQVGRGQWLSESTQGRMGRCGGIALVCYPAPIFVCWLVLLAHKHHVLFGLFAFVNFTLAVWLCLRVAQQQGCGAKFMLKNIKRFKKNLHQACNGSCSGQVWPELTNHRLESVILNHLKKEM